MNIDIKAGDYRLKINFIETRQGKDTRIDPETQHVYTVELFKQEQLKATVKFWMSVNNIFQVISTAIDVLSDEGHVQLDEFLIHAVDEQQESCNGN